MSVEAESTSANIAFFNDWAETLTVQAQNYYTDKNHEFPSLSIGPGLKGPTGDVQVSSDGYLTSPQSWFRLEFRGCYLQINIGSLIHETKLVGWSGPPGEFSCVLAPLPSGYSFWFIAGHAALRSVLVSVLGANLQSLQSSIRQKPLTISLGGSLSLVLSNLNIHNYDVKCATMSRTIEKPTVCRADVVIALTGTIDYSGSFKEVELPSSFTAPFTGLWIFAQFSVDVGDISKPKVELLHIQVSLEQINNVFGLSPLFVARRINDTYNGYVKDAINKILVKIFPLNTPTVPGIADAQAPGTGFAPPNMVPPSSSLITGQDRSTWMSAPIVQSKKLVELRIPGTHDSAAYWLELTISSILGPDLKFLGDLQPGIAPPDHDPGNKPYFLGEQAFEYVMTEVSRVAQSHHSSKSIAQQLSDGIRSFDVRLYFDKERNDFYTAHTLRGPTLGTLLQDISAFIKQQASATELIFVELSHSEISDQEISNRLADLVRDTIGDSSICLPVSPGEETKRFDFQLLKDKLVSELVIGKDGGRSSKVLFANTDTSHTCPHSILNVKEDTYWSNKSGLDTHWFTTEPTASDIVANVLNDVTDPDHPRLLLQDMAQKANAGVGELLKNNRGISRFVMDWYTEPQDYDPVGVIIDDNFSN